MQVGLAYTGFIPMYANVATNVTIVRIQIVIPVFLILSSTVFKIKDINNRACFLINPICELSENKIFNEVYCYA